MPNDHDPNIQYRRLNPDELLSFAALINLAFPLNLSEAEAREKIAGGGYDCDVIYGAVNENGRVLAGMQAYPYTSWFDGHRVPMSGIAYVASAPETRRQGNIRKIMGKIFEDAYENGVVFSHLYPFSHDYYRKFGYEHCGAAKRYTLPVAPARRLKSCGAAHEFVKGGPVRGRLIEVYEAFASRHNAMISRTEKGWEQEGWSKVLDISPFGPDRLFYWTDAGGEVKSWARFRRENKEMRISDLVWADHEAMLGILQFMGMFEGSAEKLVYTASPEFIPELYWNNLYEIGVENIWLGMSRVVNAKRALELMKKPAGEGGFVIRVADALAKWNDNTYAVGYGAGGCTVRTAGTGVEPDAEVTERALAQMVLGVYGFDQIALRDDVRVNGNTETLRQVFRRKNVFITDYF